MHDSTNTEHGSQYFTYHNENLGEKNAITMKRKNQDQIQRQQKITTLISVFHFIWRTIFFLNAKSKEIEHINYKFE